MPDSRRSRNVPETFHLRFELSWRMGCKALCLQADVQAIDVVAPNSMRLENEKSRADLVAIGRGLFLENHAVRLWRRRR